MAVTISNSPVHSDCIITYPYGVTDSGYTCGWHTGVDFAPYGDTENNPWLYPVKEGRVVYINTTTTPALGVQCQILDDDGHYWRYCHMATPSPLGIGQTVDTNTKVGVMGQTGNAFGIHLHLEYSTTSGWNYDDFLNPSDALGIPNVRGTIVHYNGTTPPTPIEEPKKKKGWKWQIFHRCKYL